MRRDVFKAIADPIRRDILKLFSYRSLNINSISQNFTVSRTAIYKHIKILKDSGLIVINQRGRDRYCKARLQSIGKISDWIEQCRKLGEKGHS